VNGEEYGDAELHEDAEISEDVQNQDNWQANEQAPVTTYADKAHKDAEVHEDGGEHENGEPCEMEKAHGDEKAGGPDADLSRNYAGAQFGGNLKKAEASLSNLLRKIEKMAWWSRPNSSTKDFGAGLSVTPSKKVNRQDGPLSTAPQKSSTYKSQGRPNGTLPPKNPFTARGSIEGSHKRKRTPELEDYLNDEVDQPPTKNGKVKTRPPKTSRKANYGASVQPSREKGLPWSQEEGDELYRLIVERRDYEKDHNQAALHDAKLFEKLSPLHNRAFPKEKRSLGACKNYWNRQGRAYYGYDERSEGKRSDSMVTSAQSSKAQRVKQQTKTKRKPQHHFKAEKYDEDESEE
jgi:hypothetical protein